MRTISIPAIWLSVVAALISLTSCDPMSSMDYRVHNMTGDTVTVTMHELILTSDYQGFAIEDNDSVVIRYGENDSINVAVLKPNQVLWVHDDWNGLYREDFITPFWKFIRSIRVGDTELPATTWNTEQAWHLKTEGGTRFKGESRYYSIVLR